jgi:DNA replication protein DnaC
LQKSSHLPAGKTLAAFDQKKLPLRLTRQLAQLCSGEFVTRAENLLIFGMPGGGTPALADGARETHFAAAIGHQLVQAGHRVLFTPTFHLVDELLRAKRDLLLERELRRLDTYEVLILDDIGYVQQSRDEMEVLFTLLAERYERRSVVVTFNLVFFTMGTNIQRPHDHRRRHRPCRPPQHHRGIWKGDPQSPSTASRQTHPTRSPRIIFSASGALRGLAPRPWAFLIVAMSISNCR